MELNVETVPELLYGFCSADFYAAFDRWLRAMRLEDRVAACAALRDETYWLEGNNILDSYGVRRVL